MTTPVFIGCDIGTSGTKAVAVTVDGTVIASSSVTYGIIQLHNNWAEQDPDIWLNAACDTISAITKQLPDTYSIHTICISALYGGTGAMCDEHMNSIRPAIIWMDRRSKEEAEELAASIGEDFIFQTSRNGIDSYFGYTKLLWVKKHEPDNWSKIRHIIPIHSYIIYKMTGQLTVDYCSAGNVGGIYDYSNHTWSKKMCDLMGIPYSTLPDNFHNPYDIIGHLNTEYQSRLGLNDNVNVCAGTVDCIASMLSAGIVQPGDNAAILGTSLNWGFIHNSVPNNPSLISMPYCISPQTTSYTYGGASTAGALPRWFVQNFIENESADSYNILERSIEEADIKPGSNGLIALPYFMGERTPIWDEKATGVIFGLTLSHTKSHIYHAILEAVAYSLRHIMESMSQPDLKIQKIVLVGGGAKSKIWKSIFANVTGLPVYTPIQEIEAPLGDAFLAAMGSGYINNFKQMENWVVMNPPIMPDMECHRKYKEYYQLYKDLYPSLKDLMQKRATILTT